MFEFLKKTISGFTGKLKQAMETKEQQEQQEEQKREIKPRLSIGTKIKKAVIGKTKIQEKDVSGLLWELELALLEGDVEQAAAEEICREIKQEIVGKEIGRGEDIERMLKEKIREILGRMMETKKIEIKKMMQENKHKPFKILFLGPNGAGKTTTIAKIAFMLQKNGQNCILAASDTFRAASIEQLEKHAKNLGARVVKHQYGADPAAVAFDAVKAAEGMGVDAVLIDSAGRQETNKNLMEELKKIVRVVKPDLKIYVGESYAGQALLQQAMEFDRELGIDAFVLTKIDADPKGGTAISLLYKTKKPVLFMGTGQDYGSLEEFRKEFIIERVVG